MLEAVAALGPDEGSRTLRQATRLELVRRGRTCLFGSRRARLLELRWLERLDGSRAVAVAPAGADGHHCPL